MNIYDLQKQFVLFFWKYWSPCYHFCTKK